MEAQRYCANPAIPPEAPRTREVLMTALLLLASLMNLTASEAIALPTVVDVACAKSGMGRDELVHRCIDNVALRDYLANACRIGAAAL